jgi:transcriptional regulator with XRE-family HTH domain
MSQSSRRLLHAALERAWTIYRTQTRLGDYLGVSQQTTSKYMLGELLPGARQTLRLARLLAAEQPEGRYAPEKLRPDLFEPGWVDLVAVAPRRRGRPRGGAKVEPDEPREARAQAQT